VKRVVVAGLGYVGLPLAVQAADKGYEVIGIDLNKRLVSMVNDRVSPFVNDARFEKALKSASKKYFKATTSMGEIDTAQIVVICVPTPTDDNSPDLSYVIDASKSVAKHLKQGQLVILESTVNPGVTRDIVLPILEKESGLICGKDFFLAHCPERIDPGNTKYFIGNLNRVVGGITDRCTKQARDFYLSVIDGKVVPLASPEEAEFVKSWENSHRNVMIALANEAAVICDALDMDINNVIKGLQSKVDQFGLKLASPGIGPGGHCIPEDIHYVITKARSCGIDTRFLDAAVDLNDKMPNYAVSQLRKMVRKNGDHLQDLNVAILGLTYKENIADTRRSPALSVAQILVQRAKSVTLHDPYIDPSHVHVIGATSEKDLGKVLRRADAVFVATGHDIYKELSAEHLRDLKVRYVLDGRNCLNPDPIKNKGIAYQGIGRR